MNVEVEKLSIIVTDFITVESPLGLTRLPLALLYEGQTYKLSNYFPHYIEKSLPMGLTYQIVKNLHGFDSTVQGFFDVIVPFKVGDYIFVNRGMYELAD